MILFAICGLSVISILYFIFRGESYRKNLAASKRENHSVKHKVTELSEMAEVLSAELTFALNYRIPKSSSEKDNDDLTRYTSLLVSALPSVVSSSLHKSKMPHESLKDFCAVNGGSVNELELFLSTQSEELLSAWRSKDVFGYVRLCRMLLDSVA